jgi:hypothetical protein
LRNSQSAIASSIGAIAVELSRVESDGMDVLFRWLGHEPTRDTSRPNTVFSCSVLFSGAVDQEPLLAHRLSSGPLSST